MKEANKNSALTLAGHGKDPSRVQLALIEPKLIEAEIVGEDALESEGAEAFELLEALIERGIQSYLEAGSALKGIRDARLYRQNYSSFDEYLVSRWQFGKARGYQLIQAAEVAEQLSTIVDSLPQNEGQIRELAKLPEGVRAEVWASVLSDGKPTAGKIREKAQAKDKKDEGWSSDDWETPNQVAKHFLLLLEEHEQNILEPTAGTGQIAEWLEGEVVHCVEINAGRYFQGKAENTHCEWFNSDLRDFVSKYEAVYSYDLIAGNLPFSQAIDLLDVSRRVLKEEGRWLLVFPIDFFSSVERASRFEELNLHIHHVHRIVNRVGYLKNGKPENKRQVYDAIFDIRKGKEGGCETLIWQEGRS